MVDHDEQWLRLADREVNLRTRLVRRPGGDERLTEIEARLLAWLVGHEGRAVPTDELLTEVWGYRPGIRSRTVITTVGRLRAKLEADPSRPRHLLTDGPGYRWSGAAPPPSPPAQSNLAPEADSFVGRATALEQLGDRVARGARMVTLHGPAGVGKTRLASRFASVRGGAWRGGAWLVDLIPVRGPGADLVRVIADAMGLSSAEVQELCSALSARGGVLLLLDNAEHQREAIMGLAPALMRAGATLLVTSREPLGLEGEHIVEVGPLPVAEGVDLLLARGGRWLDDADPPLVESLVEGLDGLPLAIELAAARLALMSPRELLERLPRRLTLLRDASRAPRHSTLEHAIQASWEPLAPRERRALAALSVFEGGFDLAALEAVVGEGPDEALDAAELLARRSLLRRAGREGRWRMLLSVRDFARQQLEASGEGPAALSRLRAWAAELADAQHALLETERAPEARERLSQELDNLLGAAGSGSNTVEAARIARALAERGRQRYDRRIEALLERLPEPPDPGLAVSLLLAREEMLSQEGRDARSVTERAFQVALASGQALLLARVRVRTGARARDQGDLARGEADLAEAAHQAEKAGSILDQGLAAIERARLLRLRGALADAVSLLSPHVGSLARDGFARAHVIASGTLASLLAAQGRGDEAERTLRRMLDAPGLRGDDEGVATVLLNLANRAVLDGRDEEAERLSRRALAMHRRRGGRRGEAFVLGNLGFVELARGRPGEAEQMFLTSSAIFAELGHALGQASMLGSAARARHAQGDPATALNRYQEAEQRLAAARLTAHATRTAALGILAQVDTGDAEAAAARWAELAPALAALPRGEPLCDLVERWLAADPAERATLRRNLGALAFDRQYL